MDYNSEVLFLKDGRRLTLRGPLEADAGASLDYLRAVTAETAYLSSYPDEIDGNLEKERAFLRRMREDPHTLWLSAFDSNGVIAGNFDIHPVSTVVRYAHRAELGIALLKAYWGSGLASALMTIMLREAKVLRYEQVELEVLAENARAVSLYQKFGFVQTGTLPHFYKYRDGRYADAHYMVCKL